MSHFGSAHLLCFEMASRLTVVLPKELNRAYFTCSGLKVAERRHIDELRSKRRAVLEAL